MGLFEDYMTANMPLRGVLYDETTASYDGDPNDGGASAVLKASPKGTRYVNSANEHWVKETDSATSWIQGSVGGGLAANVTVPLIPSTTYPYVPTETIIYMRTGGNDTTGDGSLGNPYATLPRCFQDIPQTIFPGVCYTIDCSGMGTVALTEDIYFPQWVGEANGYYDYTVDTWQLTKAAVNIRAEPTVLDTITSGDVVSDTGDPTSSVRTLVTTKSWTPGEFEGAFLVGPTGYAEIAAIAGNTATDLEVCNGYALNFPAQIVRPSTEFQAASYAPFFKMGGTASLSLNFIKLTTSFGYGTGFYVYKNPLIWLNGCELTGVISYQCEEFLMQGCTIFDDGVGVETDVFKSPYHYCRGCFGKAVDFGDKTPNARQGHFVTRESVWDGCSQLGMLDYDDGVRGGGSFIYRSEIRNSLGHGVWLGSGAMSKVFQVVIEDCADDAIRADGTAGHEVRRVVGTGNGGYGILLENGAQLLHTQTNTTVTGTLGDYKVGASAAVAGAGAGWTAFFGGAADENDLGEALPQICRMALET